jgi:periplasmic copper chaperone A
MPAYRSIGDRPGRRAVALTLACALVFAIGTGGARAASYTLGDITVLDPWARASAGKSARGGAAYMTLSSRAAGDRLIAVATPAARRAGTHRTVIARDVMTMTPVAAIEIPPGGTVALAPGGYHIMLMGLTAPLREGKKFPLTLRFEKAGRVTVEVEIKGVTARSAGATPEKKMR